MHKGGITRWDVTANSYYFTPFSETSNEDLLNAFAKEADPGHGEIEWESFADLRDELLRRLNQPTQRSRT